MSHLVDCSSFDASRLAEQLLDVQRQNQATTRLDGWFFVQEIRMRALQRLRASSPALSRVLTQAHLFAAVCDELPLSIRSGEVFAGTQDDGFARTYALINPEFKVETFAGYCDPMAIYHDITPDAALGITQERIDTVRDFWSQEEYARALNDVYAQTGLETSEVVYWVEQVTGHTIADFQPALHDGLTPLIAQARQGAQRSTGEKADFYQAAEICLVAVQHLADRYADLTEKMAGVESDAQRQHELQRIAVTCRHVLRDGAGDLYEAIQTFMLLWMAMVLEQSPNPYAFSVGNLDRMLQPFYEKVAVSPDVAVQLTRHLLALFNVADRNWAISQNIMVGGRDEQGRDLTCDMTLVVLEAFRQSNYPQPALSVKLHAHTPERVYDAMSPFFTTPGSLTPSFFNDDALFDMLRHKGIADADLPNYAIAGCQEPLIMGQESGNTTNSWLNLAKILELTIHGGYSAISGQRIGRSYEEMGLDAHQPITDAASLYTAFIKQVEHFLPRMVTAANGCTEALALLPVPFLSSFMGGLECGIDMRDTTAQGTKYNASGCLIHGLTVVADSFAAVEYLQQHAPDTLKELPATLRDGFAGHERVRDLCLAAPKFGNDIESVDTLAMTLAHDVSSRVLALRNPWDNPFLPDWSTPSTHLLYGYWVGATPDGRDARQMLNYGIDPRAGMAMHGLPPRIMSSHKLAYDDFFGGYASHIGIDGTLVKQFGKDQFMPAFRTYILNPLFGFTSVEDRGGYYAYFNVDTAEHLRKILQNPRELVPSGIYIMRIHGTFVNFLDLSPAIQEDIIARLDPDSTALRVTA